MNDNPNDLGASSYGNEKLPPLVPPDRTRCQALHQGGSFMTLGPRPWEQCTKTPVVVVTEKVPGADGRCGAMSLCEECLEIMRKKIGLGGVFIERIAPAPAGPPLLDAEAFEALTPEECAALHARGFCGCGRPLAFPAAVGCAEHQARLVERVEAFAKGTHGPA